MKTIMLARRPDDWHARLLNAPGVWACGKTTSEAVFNLIVAHADQFGIAVVRSGDGDTTRYMEELHRATVERLIGRRPGDQRPLFPERHAREGNPPPNSNGKLVS